MRNGRWDPNSDQSLGATGKLLFFSRRGDPGDATDKRSRAPALPDRNLLVPAGGRAHPTYGTVLHKSAARACSSAASMRPPRHAGLDRTASRRRPRRSCICRRGGVAARTGCGRRPHRSVRMRISGGVSGRRSSALHDRLRGAARLMTAVAHQIVRAEEMSEFPKTVETFLRRAEGESQAARIDRRRQRCPRSDAAARAADRSRSTAPTSSRRVGFVCADVGPELLERLVERCPLRELDPGVPLLTPAGPTARSSDPAGRAERLLDHRREAPVAVLRAGDTVGELRRSTEAHLRDRDVAGDPTPCCASRDDVLARIHASHGFAVRLMLKLAGATAREQQHRSRPTWSSPRTSRRSRSRMHVTGVHAALARRNVAAAVRSHPLRRPADHPGGGRRRSFQRINDQ